MPTQTASVPIAIRGTQDWHTTDVPVFLATRETQGWRTTDFFWCEEGELVTFPVTTCANENIDDACGCMRSMGGLYTSKATTTMKVSLLIAGRDHLVHEIAKWLNRGGWMRNPVVPYASTNPELIADRLIAAASGFPIGAIVERRGDMFQQRY